MQAFIREHGITQLPSGAAGGLTIYKPTAYGVPREESEWLFGKASAKCNEASLAKAKILTMLQDLGGRMQGANITSNIEQNKGRLRDAADRWFFSPKSDFEDWCDTAGFDPDYVREQAQKVCENGLPQWRAAPGTGSRYAERKSDREKTRK